MEKFIAGIILGGIIGFVYAAWEADKYSVKVVKHYVGYTWSELQSLKVDCEVSLPRDRFCKLEIKAVEEQ